VFVRAFRFLLRSPNGQGQAPAHARRALERGALQRLLPWLKSSSVLQDQPGCMISQAPSPCSVPGTLFVRAV
jgi:hypothetical protein